jgi:hypothetical protein
VFVLFVLCSVPLSQYNYKTMIQNLCSLLASTDDLLVAAVHVPSSDGNAYNKWHVLLNSMYLLCNKDQQDALFSLIYFNNHPLHVSNRLTIHHQEVALLYMQCVVFVIPYAACTVKLLPDDE